jgi:GTP-binding protein HflX
MFRFSSKAISEHAEVPLADEGHLEQLVQSWAERRPVHVTDQHADSACYVVSVGFERDALVRSAQLSEITALVESQGSRVVGQEICYLSEPNPRTLPSCHLRKPATSKIQPASPFAIVKPSS